MADKPTGKEQEIPAEDEISMTDLRRNASDIIHRVYWTQKSVKVTLRGKPVVELVSMRDDGDEDEPAE